MNAPLDVLVLSHEYPPLGGGAAVACGHLARRLVGDGHRVRVVTTAWGGTPARDDDHGVELHRVRSYRRSRLDNRVVPTMLSYLVRGGRVARRLVAKRRPDVVHAFFTVPAGAVAVGLGPPTVVSLRGSDVPHATAGDFGLKMRLVEPWIRRVWRRATRVVALSEGLRRAAALTDDAVEMRVIHNGVDSDTFRPPASPRLHTGPLRIICAARLVRRKGIHVLLDGFSAAVARDGLDARLTIAGSGDHEASLRAQAATLGDRVRFAGAVPHGEMPRVYDEHELFVLPSLTEAFGQVFTEAMASALPVIGAAVGGVPEIVRQGTDGWLVPPGDADAVRRALVAAAGERAAFDRMGAAGCERARTTFGWAACATSYVAEYRRAIAAARRS